MTGVVGDSMELGSLFNCEVGDGVETFELAAPEASGVLPHSGRVKVNLSPPFN